MRPGSGLDLAAMANPPQTDKIQIRLRKLSRSYTEGKQRHTVLSNVNAEFLQGESTAIRGRSGSGKSTLLSRLSRAHPEIADYPFTTKFPNLGLVRTGFDRQFVLADIPGLIEGAHAGVGLGHEFLRHVERTRLLVHVLDACPPDGSDPADNYKTIRAELEAHSAVLSEKPEIIALNKLDLLPDDEALVDRLVSAMKGSGR